MDQRPARRTGGRCQGRQLGGARLALRRRPDSGGGWTAREQCGRSAARAGTDRWLQRESRRHQSAARHSHLLFGTRTELERLTTMQRTYMNHQSNPILLALVLGLAGVATPGRADEIAGKVREIFEKNHHAVVTVQVVLKVSYSGAAKTSETRQEITGTVLDPSGLTVLALSAAGPSEMYRSE